MPAKNKKAKSSKKPKKKSSKAEQELFSLIKNLKKSDIKKVGAWEGLIAQTCGATGITDACPTATVTCYPCAITVTCSPTLTVTCMTTLTGTS